MFETNYNFLDRVLHQLALRYVPIADVSFDVDQTMVRTDPKEIIPLRHVFVAGLARAGSTVLMRRFHATGCFRSLTYRDMPFVLAPNLWRRLSLTQRRDIRRAERAHGDNLMVDSDSPESLDEVFWRIFAGEEYIRSDRLSPHAPDEELLRKYVHYVNAILSAQDTRAPRYLSKNNNNILRLDAIHQAFPNALILVPFRQPLQHALSLLHQHVRFSEMQAAQKFVLAYMTWLGHHEFGLGHRPFSFNGTHFRAYPVTGLDYWLELWCEVYSWLLRSKPGPALFVCYEDLCTRSETWRRLAELADTPHADIVGEPLKLSERPTPVGVDRGLADRASALYTQMLALTGYSR